AGESFRSGNKTVSILWNRRSKPETASIPVNGKTTLIDIMGRESELAAKDGKVELTLTENPVYLIIDAK
ncbi:MAG: hypothetical protein WAX69_03575, partial [Victivallales bacterium]